MILACLSPIKQMHACISNVRMNLTIKNNNKGQMRFIYM